MGQGTTGDMAMRSKACRDWSRISRVPAPLGLLGSWHEVTGLCGPGEQGPQLQQRVPWGSQGIVFSPQTQVLLCQQMEQNL